MALRKYILKSIKVIFRKLGYELTRPLSYQYGGIEPRPDGGERDREGYDKVWSDDAFVVEYSEMHSVLYTQIVDFVKAHGLIKGIKSVADIGCGPGNLLYMLSQQWPDIKYFGSDFSSAAVATAKRKVPTAEFETYDVYDQLGKSFDLVFCCETLEHLLYPDKALANILQIAKITCVLTVPDGRVDSYPGHINFWSEDSWKIFLEPHKANWEIQTYRIPTGLAAILKKR